MCFDVNYGGCGDKNSDNHTENVIWNDSHEYHGGFDEIFYDNHMQISN